MKAAINDRLLLIGIMVLLGFLVVTITAHAENTVQTVEMVRVDVQKLSTGYRTSKLIGTSIMSDANETIGKIDDLIVSPDDNKTAYVILSVGGWLGMGTHLIALPYDTLRISTAKIVLPGATKDKLKGLPEFKYSTT